MNRQTISTTGLVLACAIALTACDSAPEPSADPTTEASADPIIDAAPDTMPEGMPVDDTSEADRNSAPAPAPASAPAAAPARKAAADPIRGSGGLEDKCLARVGRETGARVIGTNRIEESQAAIEIYVNVEGAKAPWKCLGNRNGSISEVSYTGSEGDL